MRKLALIGAIAALWLFVAAATAFADGGPHSMATNNGTAGISADSCAGCHRAHTATAANLLNADQPEICLNCHDGSKATTDVVAGVQYSATSQTLPVLGALRGGGFQFSLIDSSNAARLSYTSGTAIRNIGHVQSLATGTAITSTHGGVGGIYAAGWGTGTVWGNGAVNSGTGASVTLECGSCHNPHGNGQYRILQTKPALTATTGAFTMSIANGVEITDTATTGLHNYTIKPASDGKDQNGSATNIVAGSKGDYWRYHWDPSGVLNWALTTGGPGADPMNTGWNGASATNAKDYGTAATTLGAGALAADKCFAASSATGFPAVPFFVTVDSEISQVTSITATTTCASGWTVTRAQGGTTAAAHGSGAAVTVTSFNVRNATTGQALTNTTGLMTAWCITCHTRYSGLTVNGSPSSLTDNSGGDTVFMFKHGTTRIGCEQCHVAHGSNAAMTGSESRSFTNPAGTVPAKPGAGVSGDSRLLKVDNRGTCQMCHDPTGTVTTGTYLGPLPTPGN